MHDTFFLLHIFNNIKMNKLKAKQQGDGQIQISSKKYEKTINVNDHQCVFKCKEKCINIC